MRDMYKFKRLAILALLISAFQFANAQFPRVVNQNSTASRTREAYSQSRNSSGHKSQRRPPRRQHSTQPRRNKQNVSNQPTFSSAPFQYKSSSYGSANRSKSSSTSSRFNTFASKLSAGVYADYLMCASKPMIQEAYSPMFDGFPLKLSDFDVGAIADVQLLAKSRNVLSVEFAAAYRGIIQSSTVNGYKTTYSATDPDGDAYERSITVSDYHEKTFTQGFVIPIAFRYDFFFHKQVSLFATAGIKNSFLFSQKSKALFDARYAGIYGEEFFNITIDQNGIYDFGIYSNNSLELTQKHFQYDLYGSFALGIQFFINRTLSVEAAAMYLPRIVGTKAAGSDGFVLSPSADRFQSVTDILKPGYESRWGVTLRVKANF